MARRLLLSRGAGATQEDVEDVTENVFLALMEKDFHLLKRYDPNHKLTTYLGVITRTQCHRWLRSRRFTLSLPDEADQILPDAQGPTSADQLFRREAVGALRQAMTLLNERELKVLRLFYFEGADYQAIAVALEVKVNSVGALLTRARARLQKELKKVSDLSESDYRAL